MRRTALIQPGTVTLPSLLKQAGYTTAVIGKWHLGLGNPPAPDWNGKLSPGPTDIGFDHCFILPTTNDRVPCVYVEGRRVRNLDPADPLVVSSTNPDNQPTGITHRDTLRMDWSRGHNNTIHNGIGRMGFFSGGQKARWRDEDLADTWVAESVKWMETNREKPFFLLFAAHDIHVPRMPFITHWPETIKPGESGELVCTIDLPASLAALTGQTLPENACPDSFNLMDALLGAKDARGRDHLVQQDNKGPGAIQANGWKLVKNKELYNLNDDPAEEKNLITAHPEKAAALKLRLEEIIAQGHSRR